jgi:hypothetical protein
VGLCRDIFWLRGEEPSLLVVQEIVERDTTSR